MVLDDRALEVLSISAAAAALLALLLAFVVLVRMRKLRRIAALFQADSQGQSIVESASTHIAAIDQLRADFAKLRREMQEARAEVASAVKRTAVVRYDAFEDLAGRLSFSAAVLNDAGDGLVFTAITGRMESRTYVKDLHAGKAVDSQSLSPEEHEAVSAALGRSRAKKNSRLDGRISQS